MDNNQPDFNKSSKKRSSNRIIIAIFALLLFAGGVIAYITYISSGKDTVNKPEEVKTTSKNSESIAKNNDLTPKEIIEKIKASLSTKYSLINADNSSPGEADLMISDNDISGNWKPDGYDFYVWNEKGAHVSITTVDTSSATLPNDDTKAVRENIAQVLSNNEINQTSSVGGESGGMALIFYDGRGVVCSTQPVAAQISTTTVSCGKKSDLIANAKEIALIVKNNQDITSNTTLGGLNLKNSKSPGYKIAKLVRGDITDPGQTLVHFYKKGNEDWQYLTKSIDSSLACSLISNDDLKAAYVGEKCIDDAGNESTIK